MSVKELRELIDLVNDDKLSVSIALDIIKLYFEGSARGPVSETITKLGLWRV